MSDLIQLTEYQQKAVNEMHNGCILVGGVGSGKSLAALSFIFTKWLDGLTPVVTPGQYRKPSIQTDIYIITTARKRDSTDWLKEASNIPMNIKSIDSWNNISKYINIKDSIFIFDEQRVVGSGTWSKEFIKIAKSNQWILLSATPGDNWTDYIPVFIANGFYKNRTDFCNRHIIYSRFSKYPKVERYLEISRLIRLRDSIIVRMPDVRHTVQHHMDSVCDYDVVAYNRLLQDRWNIFTDSPVRDISELCYALRQVVNSDESRVSNLDAILNQHPRLIIFYNFDYELEILRDWCIQQNIQFSEWNGHLHQEIPEGKQWVYICQYTAASEAWNAITTDTIIFYSQTYSYKQMIQAAGRIDRMNTPFTHLYYFHLLSCSSIDNAIRKSLNVKQNFNETLFVN